MKKAILIVLSGIFLSKNVYANNEEKININLLKEQIKQEIIEEIKPIIKQEIKQEIRKLIKEEIQREIEAHFNKYKILDIDKQFKEKVKLQKEMEELKMKIQYLQLQIEYLKTYKEYLAQKGAVKKVNINSPKKIKPLNNTTVNNNSNSQVQQKPILSISPQKTNFKIVSIVKQGSQYIAITDKGIPLKQGMKFGNWIVELITPYQVIFKNEKTGETLSISIY